MAPCLRKVKLLRFNGMDPRGWITKPELYFQMNQKTVTHKLQLEQMYMGMIALIWYTNLMIKHTHTDWTQLRDKLLVRFSGTQFWNAHEALGSMFQEGPIKEYIGEFEAMSSFI